MAKVKDRYLKPVLKLYDINKNWICNLTTNNPKNSIYNLKKNMKINEVDTLSFQVAFDNTHISPDSCEMLIKHEFDWYIIKSVTLNSSNVRYLDVECESEFTISKTVTCEPIEIIGESPQDMFNQIMKSVPDNKLNYIFKETDLTNKRSLIVEDETSLFENLVKMAETFECMVRFSYGSNGEKYVTFRKETYDRGRVIRRNNNLKSLSIVYDTSELFTKVMPFGADDDGIELNIADVNPTGKLYVENYEYFLAKGMTEEQIKNNMQAQALKIVRYSDIVDENDLYNLALRDLKECSMPRVRGSVEYADTSVLEGSISIEPIIYEKIRIADSEIKMTLSSNITEIEIDYENILNSKITLDNVIEYSSVFKDLISQGEKIDSVVSTNPSTGKPSLIGSAIKGKIDASVASIEGQVDVAEKMKPYAILFECNIVGHDLYGATALGTQGLLIAKEKNIDNSWKWKTAVNANGIYADELVGLKIVGETIVGGTIQSLDKSTWISLEDGTFNFADKIKFVDNKFTIVLSNGQTLEEWKTEYEQNKNDINKDIEDIYKQLDGISGDIGDAFLDGIIDEMESSIIKDRLSQFNKEKDDIAVRYENLYNNIALYGESKVTLKTNYDLFISRHVALVNKINEIITDKKATDEEQAEYGIAVMEYNATIPQLSKAFDEALNCIAVNTSKSQLDDLKNTLDNDIKNVSESVSDLENTMNSAFRDGIVDEAEKIVLKDKIDTLEVEKLDIDRNYQNIIGNTYLDESVKTILTTKYNLYISKHTELITLINSVISDSLISEDEFNSIKIKISEYNDDLSEYNKVQTSATNNIIDNTINYNVDSLRQDVSKDIDDLNGRVNDIIEDVGGAVADGIINEAEALIIKNSITQLDKEKNDITTRYESIYNHERLNGSSKTNLRDKYNNFIQAHYNLVTQINEMISDNYATDTEKVQYEINIVAYSNALGSLSKAFDEAINYIAEAGTNAVAEALKKELQGNIKDVADITNGLKDDLNGYTADGILDEAEKKSIRVSLKTLTTEKKDVDSQYIIVYENTDLSSTPKSDLKTAYDNYVSAYNMLLGVITLMLDSETITETLKNNLDNAFIEHDEKLSVYSQRVNKAIDAIASKKADTVKEFVKSEVEVLNKSIALKVNTEDMEAYVKVEADKITSSVEKEYVKINDAVNYSIIVDNEHQGIPTTNIGFPLKDTTYTINFQVFKGSSSEEVPFAIKSTISSTTKGITVEKADKYIAIKTDTKVAFEELEGYINVVIVVGEYEFTKKITWNIVRQGENGLDGVDGTPGIDGSNAYFHIKYAPNANPTPAQMTETPQEYMGTYSDNNPEDSTDPKKYTWYKVLGKDGTSVRIDGSKATVEEIYAIQNPEVGSGYMCEANGHLYVYTTSGWSDVGRIQGEQGLPGAPGLDGKTPYLHIKYSDDGVSFTSNNGETAGKYLGQYTDFIQSDSMVFSQYTWKKIEGDRGEDGIAGTNGVDGQDGDDSIVATITNDTHLIPTDLNGNNGNYTGCDTTIELHKGEGKVTSGITYAYTPSTGIVGSGSNGKYTVTNMTVDSGYVDLKATYKNVTYTCRFTIAKAKKGNNGTNGSNGVDGTDGKDAYTINLSNENHTFVADYNGNISSVVKVLSVVSAFKGVDSITPTIGTLPTVVGLSLSKSGTTITIQANTGTTLAENGTFDIPIIVDGISFTRTFSYSKTLKGKDGTNGVAGSNGIDGKTPYFHIKYSSVANPTSSSQMSETVNTYIGTYVDYIEVDSNDPNKYTWSKFIGQDGNNGTNGTPGVNGIDGKTSYLHIKYSDNGVNFTSNNGETPGAWMGQYVDYTEADSNTFSKYIWSKIKGDDGSSASYVDANASTQFFKCAANSTTYSPSSISIVPTFVNCTYSSWQYSLNGGSTWINVTSGSNGLTISGNVLSIANTSALFTSSVTTITFKVNASGSKFDIVSISRLKDGDNGTNGNNGKDSVNILLSNESHTFVATSNGNAIKTNITTSVYGYVGTVKTACTIGSISGLPTGMSTTINNNGTTSTSLTVSATTSLNTKNGTVTIPITCNGVTINKIFTYSLAVAGTNGNNGANGSDALSANLTATSQVFKSNDGGNTYSPIQIVVTANYQNCTHSTWQYSTGGSFATLNNGTGGINVSGTTVTIPVTSSLYTTTNNCITLKCISSNSTVYDTITIFKLLDRSDINQVIEQVKSDIVQTNEDWKATFKEGYKEGVTTVNQYGIKVSHSNIGTKTQMSADGLSIIDTNGDVIAWLSNKEQWTEVKADKVFANNIENIYEGESELYVNHSYIGDSDGSANKPFKSFADLQKYLELTPTINKDLYIYIKNPGFEITEQLFIHNLKGTGFIKFTLDSTLTMRNIGQGQYCVRMYQIQKLVWIVGGRSTSDSSDGALLLDNNDGGGGNGMSFADITKVRIDALTISCKSTGISVARCDLFTFHVDYGTCYLANNLENQTIYYSNDDCGGCASFFRSNSGSKAFLGSGGSGCRPKGIMEASTGVYFTFGTDRTQKDSCRFPSSTSNPTPPANNIYTQSFTWTSHKTYQYSWSNWGDSDCKQGAWSAGLRGGHMFFDIASIRRFLSGIVQDGNTITLTRASSGGNNGSSNVYINGSTCSSASGTPSYGNQTLLGTLSWGETKTFTLPKAIVDGLKSGSYNSLAVYVNSTASNNYLNIVNASITLKVSK